MWRSGGEASRHKDYKVQKSGISLACGRARQQARVTVAQRAGRKVVGWGLRRRQGLRIPWGEKRRSSCKENEQNKVVSFRQRWAVWEQVKHWGTWRSWWSSVKNNQVFLPVQFGLTTKPIIYQTPWDMAYEDFCMWKLGDTGDFCQSNASTMVVWCQKPDHSRLKINGRWGSSCKMVFYGSWFKRGGGR